MDADADRHSSPAAPRGVRLFFALVPDADVRTALARLARKCAGEAGGRPSSPEAMHLTLAFIGEVDASRRELLAAIGARLPRIAFDVDLDRIGGFRAARVAWIAPSAPPEALSALQVALATELASAGFPTERRPFRPHLTLARHCRVPLASVPTPNVHWPVSRLALIESTLDPAGARYREVAGWELAPPSSPAPCS
jgi:2'-5' RNA ligase